MSKKEVCATACYFWEIFSVTGPLRLAITIWSVTQATLRLHLQTVNTTIGKVINMIYSSIIQLQKLGHNPEIILKMIDETYLKIIREAF